MNYSFIKRNNLKVFQDMKKSHRKLFFSFTHTLFFHVLVQRRIIPNWRHSITVFCNSFKISSASSDERLPQYNCRLRYKRIQSREGNSKCLARGGGAAKFSSYFVQLHRKSNKSKLGQALQHLLRLAALFQYELLESP